MQVGRQEIPERKGRTVALYGAFDRYNYGDLLFPIITRKLWERRLGPATFQYYGLLASDLSEYGGVPTRPLTQLFARNELPDGSVVIVPGGDVLSADWTYLYLCHRELDWILRWRERLWGRQGVEMGLRRRFCPSLVLPYAISPADFRQTVTVAYQAIGGIGLHHYPEKIQGAVRAKLTQAAYVGVRDSRTRSTLAGPGGPGARIRLVPDSAVLLSDVFPVGALMGRLTPRIRQIIEAWGQGKYAVFQAADRFNEDEVAELARQLDALYGQTGLPCFLLPIGRALKHDDHLLLARLRARMRAPAELPEFNTIHDTMGVIAQAAVFAGTSLHGAITAISYAVPHVGLRDCVPKVDTFLADWDLPEQQACVEASGLAAGMQRALALPRARLEARAAALKSACNRAFDEMIQCLR